MKYLFRLFPFLYILYQKLDSLFSYLKRCFQSKKEQKVDLEVSTEELLFSKHQLVRLIKEGTIKLPHASHKDHLDLYCKNISEQTSDEYREQLLQEMEDEGLIVLKNKSSKKRQPECLAEYLLGCPW